MNIYVLFKITFNYWLSAIKVILININTYKHYKMKINEIEPLVKQWAEEKNLIKIENALKQADKTQEELDEFKFNLKMQKYNYSYYHNDIEKAFFTEDQIKDDIGDILVTLIIQCEIQRTSLEECLNVAWEQIKDRTGKTINGTFLKDE